MSMNITTPEKLIGDIQDISVESFDRCHYDDVRVIMSSLVMNYNSRIYDITILATYAQVVVRMTELLHANARIAELDHKIFVFEFHEYEQGHGSKLKQDIINKLRLILGLQPVLNDSYEFTYRDRHFMVDTCKNNPQICVVFDVDDDYKTVLAVGLESGDELVPGKEVPDYIIRLMY